LDRLGWHVGVVLLARVDGRSPVSYLDPSGVEVTRTVATHILGSDRSSFEDVWSIVLEGRSDR
jgi:hypothetical protein